MNDQKIRFLKAIVFQQDEIHKLFVTAAQAAFPIGARISFKKGGNTLEAEIVDYRFGGDLVVKTKTGGRHAVSVRYVSSMPQLLSLSEGGGE